MLALNCVVTVPPWERIVLCWIVVLSILQVYTIDTLLAWLRAELTRTPGFLFFVLNTNWSKVYSTFLLGDLEISR